LWALNAYFFSGCLVSLSGRNNIILSGHIKSIDKQSERHINLNKSGKDSTNQGLLNISLFYISKLVIYVILQLMIRKEIFIKQASELYRPSDRRLSAKLVPTLADRGCHVVSATDPLSR
jgi:hypothetical protein